MIDLRPSSRDEAVEIIRRWHRHHKRDVGYKFAIAAESEGEIVGVVVVGRPKAQQLQDGRTFEVTRLCTNGHPNAASRLLGAARRAAFAMGVRRLVSYTRADEEGVCYKAAGWERVAETRGRAWDEHTDSARVQQALPGVLGSTTEIVDRVRWETFPGRQRDRQLTRSVDRSAPRAVE